MTAPITIRPATEQDIPTILGFIRDLAKYEHLEHEVVATESSLRQTLFGARPYAEVVFASLDGIPQGFALFFHNYSTFLGKPGIYLEDLFVRPQHRGKGIGKALLSTVAAIAQSEGCPRLEWAVLDWNTPAIDFYHSLGALPMSEWTTMRVSGPALTQLAALTAPHSKD